MKFMADGFELPMTEASIHSTWSAAIPKMFSYIHFLIPDYNRRAGTLSQVDACCL